MKKYKITKTLRTLVQIIFFIFFPGLVSMAFLEIKTLFIDIFSANFASILPDCFLFIILAVFTFLFGRFFCGFMCMFGTYNDIINLIGKKVFKINYRPPKKADKYLKYLKYIILIFITCFVWTSIVKIPSGSSPWDAIMQLTNLAYAFKNYIIGLIILLLITIGDLFIERFFCRYLCPLGAVFAILSKARIIKIKKERSVCGPCRACTLKCSMGIDLDAVDVVKSGECIDCLNCVAICPKKNAKMAINGKAINEYVAAIVAVSAATGIYLAADNFFKSYTPKSNKTATVKTYKYKDGTYTGTGTGYRPNLKVSVTISNDKIKSITLISTNDTDDFFSKAWSRIKSAILSKQSTNVNTVSGATHSSEGIIEAINDALQKAKDAKENKTTTTTSATTTTVERTTTTTTKAATGTYKDGTYTGSGYGHRGQIQVSVTISNGKITSINLVSDNDTPEYFNRAWSTVPNEIISSQSTNVNVVSGATHSSDGIIEAVQNALAEAKQ